MREKLVLFGIAILTMFSIGDVAAQQKELKKMRLNVFRVDAATVAAQARGLFAVDGVEV